MSEPKIQWVLSNLERAISVGELTDVVTTVHWRCVASDGELRADVYGATSLPPPDAAAQFVPFEKLVEAEVLLWLHATMGKDTVSAHESTVLARLAEAREPETVSGTPW